MKKKYDKIAESIENKQAARAAVERLREILKDRREAVEYAPPVVETDVWCQRCQRDVTTTCCKEVRLSAKPFIAFYRGVCPAGHWCIRRITDIETDPYFYQSAYVKKLRVERGDDLIQPDHPYFKYVFPLQWAELEKQRSLVPTNLESWK